MLPVYDPKSFASMDLRKYHIRDVQDVIRFNEFVASRMEEAEFVLKKFSNQLATFQTLSQQLRQRVEKENQSYGAGAKVEETTTEEVKVEQVEDTVEQEHESLLDDIRQAVAEEEMVPEEGEDPNERAEAILDKYKVINGKKGPMFYRDGGNGFKLISKKDVPEDIKEQLLAALEG